MKAMLLELTDPFDSPLLLLNALLILICVHAPLAEDSWLEDPYRNNHAIDTQSTSKFL